ncbi:membrane hypothetical protein [Vibrio crassostreae]|uniref:macro domain-containing protein n=1 Tax=Vibrio crassostreae TaxID=246167 RepID=UPI00104EC770|nr:macro domain-containing protein [Vibrio crassostreae]TCW11246.1 hypothetical protein EDB49_1011050 [Vibrio crassostreae]CAK3289714.1 membrane hypothetical protein [Vibrio crassostreae]CAK3320657.1 membrane hypothetical protein [Vibrio crassostreae]CAK3787319.1 membrane hypothetical protein [Vibrio crassostreae]
MQVSSNKLISNFTALMSITVSIAGTSLNFAIFMLMSQYFSEHHNSLIYIIFLLQLVIYDFSHTQPVTTVTNKGSMKKVNFCDAQLRQNYFAVLSLIGLITSFCLIVIKVPDESSTRFTIGVCLALFLSAVYVYMWFNANSRKNASLTINNSKIDVKVGDIFYTEGLKVIAFNEYFDSIVDNDIISEGSLNGIYINTKVDDLAEFDKTLDDNASLNRKVCDTNNDREKGKNKKYKLGTIYKKDDFLLTAFSKFDNDNRAYLNIDDYIEFLLNFWNEVDIIYSGRSVVIPLLGSGITRFKGYDAISEQELLELLIWSFKVSRMKFTYPSTVTILIHESKVDKINFYALQGD